MQEVDAHLEATQLSLCVCISGTLPDPPNFSRAFQKRLERGPRLTAADRVPALCDLWMEPVLLTRLMPHGEGMVLGGHAVGGLSTWALEAVSPASPCPKATHLSLSPCDSGIL